MAAIHLGNQGVQCPHFTVEETETQRYSTLCSYVVEELLKTEALTFVTSVHSIVL